jgi:creatinase
LTRCPPVERAKPAGVDTWEKNVAVQRLGPELIRPGARCKDMAAELDEMYAG